MATLVGGTWLWLVGQGEMRAVWPSLVALGIVLLTRRAVPGLLAGAYCGTVLLHGGDPLMAFVALFRDHLLPALRSPWNSGAIVFTLVLGGFASLLEKGGGLRSAVARWVERDPPRRVLWGAYFLGFVCFFDGLANALMVGRLMRQLGDQAGVARERLAYVVDSTSSPVACVAFISTWIAFQLGLIRQAFESAGWEAFNPYNVFFASVPYNYYCWLTLIAVALFVARDWRIGPMRHVRPVAGSLGEREPDSALWRSLVPLGFLIAAILGGLFWEGYEPGAGFSAESVAAAFGRADAPLVLVLASVSAAILAMVLFPPEARRRGRGASEVFRQGASNMLEPVVILVSAWTLGSTLKALGAASYLASLFTAHLPLEVLPCVVFLLAAVSSFCTGTSWGTMALVMPLALGVGLAALEPGSISALPAMVVAAVFSGAVFGDHCSPLSDTTLVSAFATGTPVIAHVTTQFPYALLVGLISAICGFLPAGLGWGWGVGWVLGTLVLFGLSRHRRPPAG